MVLETPSCMVNFGFHPRARIFLVSSKMNGLSPIHPRSPPVYSNSGCKPNVSPIHPIELLTSH